MWEKEKLLVTSNFYFFQIVFKRLVLQAHKNQGLFGKGLNILLNTSSVMAAEVVLAKYKVGMVKFWSLLGWFYKKRNIRKVVCIYFILN